MSAASLTISQSASGSVITILDTGTYATVSSRTVIISDANGTFLASPTFSGLSATYDITTDLYLSFVLTVIDNTGTFTATKNYLSTAFTDIAYVNTIAQLGCGCNAKETLTMADICLLFRTSALRLALGGLAPAAQANITAAYNIITGG